MTTVKTVTGTLLSVTARFYPTPYGEAIFGHAVFTGDDGEMHRVAVVNYCRTGVTFTPANPTGPQPETLEDLGATEWWFGDIRGDMASGLPTLPEASTC